MSIEIWGAFAALSIVILMIPGPTILTVVSYSLLHGRRGFAPIVSAVLLGDSTAITVSLLGLGTLLETSAHWFTIVKSLGALYLLYLGFKFLRAGRSIDAASAAPTAQSRRQLFINTYLVAVLNPKGIVFYVAFFPQFLDPDGSVALQLSLMAVTFIVLGSINSTLYSLFAGSSRMLLATRPAQQGLRIAGGSLLSGAGLYALLARRPL